MSGSRKRARMGQEPPQHRPPPSDDGLGGLYDFLPPPDPEKDAAAKTAAEKATVGRPKLPTEDPTRVIFLDVDGVLLACGTVEMIVIDGVGLPLHHLIKESDFSSAALGSLRTILEQTGAGIVLSSEWRRTEQLRNAIQGVLKQHELPTFRGFTPIFEPKVELQRIDPILAWSERRAREIGQWLSEHREVTSWVALDDLDFAPADSVRAGRTPWVKVRSVHTHPRHCLTEADAADAVRILQHPPPDPKPLTRRPSRDNEPWDPNMLASTEDSAPERLRLG